MRLYNYEKRDTSGGFITPEYDEGECVIALGFFDGVHLGHRRLLSEARERADELGFSLGVFTFSSEGGLKAEVPRLQSTSDRIKLFEGLEVDFAVVADFGSVADLSPDAFVKEVLVGELRARVCVAGYNFRFGKSAAGDAQMLNKLVREVGCESITVGEVTDGNKCVSASVIREMIAEGRMRDAARLLTLPYSVSAEAVHGRGFGRVLGFPTVNTELDTALVIPKRGVYRTGVLIDGGLYTALTNVGTCPTFGERSVHLETYILGFNGDVYGDSIRIYFLDYLRDEMSFDGAESLKMQIKDDIYRVLEEIGEVTWQEIGLS